jgi:hypothetical protein
VEQQGDQGDVAGQAVALDGADEGALLAAVEPSRWRLDLLDGLGGDDLLRDGPGDSWRVARTSRASAASALRGTSR